MLSARYRRERGPADGGGNYRSDKWRRWRWRWRTVGAAEGEGGDLDERRRRESLLYWHQEFSKLIVII